MAVFGADADVADAVDQILKSAYKAQYLQASAQLDALEALMDPDNSKFFKYSASASLTRRCSLTFWMLCIPGMFYCLDQSWLCSTVHGSMRAWPALWLICTCIAILYTGFGIC